MPEIVSAAGMLLLMALVLAGAYVAARAAGKGFQPRGTARDLCVLEHLALDRDKSLLVVRVGKRVFLLGAAPQGVTKLEELDPEEFSAQEARPQPARFSTALQEAVRKAVGGEVKK